MSFTIYYGQDHLCYGFIMIDLVSSGLIDNFIFFKFEEPVSAICFSNITNTGMIKLHLNVTLHLLSSPGWHDTH